MELRHIRYFVAVAEELNFTRAAARLGIGQPPLSQQIKDLEAELGVALFRRVPHGAELTEASKTFLEEGRRALVASQGAANAARRAGRGEFGRLRVGFTGSAHFNAVVPSLVRDFSRRYPDVHLEFEEANTYRLLDMLALGTLDAAFAHSGLEDRARFDTTQVKNEPLVAVLPSGHRLSAEAAVPLAGLAEDTFILKPRRVGPELHKAIFEACEGVGFEPRLGHEAPQLATVVSFVAAGLGVSLVPTSMQQMKAAGVTYLPLAGAQASVNLSLVWRRHEGSTVVKNFVGLAKAAATSA